MLSVSKTKSKSRSLRARTQERTGVGRSTYFVCLGRGCHPLRLNWRVPRVGTLTKMLLPSGQSHSQALVSFVIMPLTHSEAQLNCRLRAMAQAGMVKSPALPPGGLFRNVRRFALPKDPPPLTPLLLPRLTSRDRQARSALLAADPLVQVPATSKPSGNREGLGSNSTSSQPRAGTPSPFCLFA